MSEFEIGIRSAMDREESKKTSDRMLVVREREAKAGLPRISGRRPFGYEHDMTKTVPEEAKLIREAARRVLAGESVWSICKDWAGRSRGARRSAELEHERAIAGVAQSVADSITVGDFAVLERRSRRATQATQW